MSERPFKTPPEDGAMSAVELIGILLSAVWMIGVGAYFWFIKPSSDTEVSIDGLRSIMTMIAIFMPVAMIWVAVAAARSARVMRQESRRLQVAIDGMRETYVNDRAKSAVASSEPTVERKLDEINRTQGTATATFSSNRQGARRATDVPTPPAAAADDQASLALGTRAEDMTAPLSNHDLIRAINFPDTEQDQAGFDALRRALQDRGARELVQASQDILTLLSQDGIYMDDLRPDRARPEIWRRFSSGERGRAVASLGGIRDRSSLALTAARMREDTIFRDTAHHFLRKFDQMLVKFEPNASDEDLIALAETRSARAFMVLGRVTGAFD